MFATLLNGIMLMFCGLQCFFLEQPNIQHQISTHVLRITPADFYAAFTDKHSIFRSEMTSGNSALSCLHAKTKPLFWVALDNDLRANLTLRDITSKGICQLLLDTWSHGTREETRARRGPRSPFQSCVFSKE